MLKIISVTFEKEYQIILCLHNNTKIMYDMKKRIVTARFCDLKDEKIFKAGEISECGKYISWNNHTEISLEEILYF